MSTQHHGPRQVRGDRFLDELLAKLKIGYERARQYLKGRAALRSIDNDPEFQAAREYKKNFSLRDGVDYKWVCEYAKSSYDMLQETLRGLDEKADTIIRHLTGGTGLLALGSIAFISQGRTNALIALMALPSFVVALIGVAIAIRTRMPADTKLPPKVDGAVQYAEYFAEHAEGTFIGQWHEACEGVAIAAAIKAKGVWQAYVCYLLALVLLAIPFVGGAILKLTVP